MMGNKKNILRINLLCSPFAIVIFILVSPGYASIFNSSTEVSKNNRSSVDIQKELPQKINEISSNPLHTIDLTKCKCVPKEDFCQIAITKSVVMEVSCPEELNYCCNTTSSEKNEHELEKKSPKVNIFIPTAIEPASKLEVNQNNSTIRTFNSNTSNFAKNESNINTTSISNEKHKPKCRCKPRNKCHAKYADYGFGFDCSYSTVRCCEPESVILKEKEDALLESGKIILAGNKQTLSEKSTDDIAGSNIKSSEDCFCLPINRCKIDPNTIGKRKDTLCPYDLVQCCGEFINDTKEEVEVPKTFPPNLSSLSDSKISEARVGMESGAGVIMHGQPAFWQPVQLPLMKIPLRGEEESQVESVVTTTMPPPQLPTHYYYQPPSYHMDYYHPSSQSQYGNSPWTSLTHTSPYYTNQYSRYHPGQAGIQPSAQYESARSNEENPTLLKTIANLLG